MERIINLQTYFGQQHHRDRYEMMPYQVHRRAFLMPWIELVIMLIAR